MDVEKVCVCHAGVNSLMGNRTYILLLTLVNAENDLYAGYCNERVFFYSIFCNFIRLFVT